MTHTLEISGIRLLFDERLVLSDIYLKIETGNVVGVLGRNGEGKSCLMRVILGTLKTEKSIFIDDASMYEAYKYPELIRYLPQHNFIPKSLSLKRIFNDFQVDFSAFIRLFPDFQDLQNTKTGRLSGGMFRLTELYLIIKSDTKFVLLDEPFTHISPLQIAKIKMIIDEESVNKGFFITDHMHRHILNVCDRIYLLVHGKTHLMAEPGDLEKFGYLSKCQPLVKDGL
jgi:ABC-type (unclassified) transport system, ATPase component